MASSTFLAAMGVMSVPPGFTRLTSFTLQRVERDTSVAAPVHSIACGEGDKLRKLLQHRPWVNYSGACTISDSEDEDMPDQSLPNGVIADVAVTGTSLQSQHGQSPFGQMSGTGGSSRAGGTAAAMAPNSMPAQQLNLPRFVEVGEERRHTFEIPEYGTVMPDELWSTRWEIFPKGFHSRARYWSVVEPNKRCAYVSEILDAGLVGPLFMKRGILKCDIIILLTEERLLMLLVLQELLKKANPEELGALEAVLRDASSSSNTRLEVFLLLTEEIRSRQH